MYSTRGSTPMGNCKTKPTINHHFELPTAERQEFPDTDEPRRQTNARPSTLAETLELSGGMDESSPPCYLRSHDGLPTRDEMGRWRVSESSTKPGVLAVSQVNAKPKRVRTGCLTCRNRHLKCDEAAPVCMNCQKSNRKCERGVRLNFIDLKIEKPPYLLPRVDWKVQFQDESRQIASEYVGGLARYAKFRQQVAKPFLDAEAEIKARAQRLALDHTQSPFVDNPRIDHLEPPSILYHQGTVPRLHEPRHPPYEDQMGHNITRKSSDSLMTAGMAQRLTASHSSGVDRMPSHGTGPGGHNPYGLRGEDAIQPVHGYKTSVSSVASSLVPQGAATSSSASIRQPTVSGAPDPNERPMTPHSEKNTERDYLNSPEEIHYMQVFIEEVSVWMDSLDSQKHFGRVTPYLALKSPMLMNAFLACGVRHLTLHDNANHKEDRALHYYDTATSQLLRSLQNPERNTAECATTAVVLNVYEIMSEKPAVRMNHTAGARALIRECKWDARSTGIGAACFWLNVGMEVLSCLAFNWATAWDPDQWGIDPEEFMGMGPDARCGGDVSISQMGTPAIEGTTFPGTRNIAGVGDEEIWIHRILYIVAQVANFRANIPRFQEPNPHDEQARLQSRFAEWQRLKNWCDGWNAHCPRSMRPYGYLNASTTSSAFPNVWLINRPATVGRLFYHTAMCLLAQMNPLKPAHHHEHADEIRSVQLHHAHQVCGIVAHTKDNGVASVAIRSLAIAGAVLTDDTERREVVVMLTSIYRAKGWDLQRVHSELKRVWGWGQARDTTDAVSQTEVMLPSSQGGTLGDAAVMTQLFGIRITKSAGASNNASSSSSSSSASTHETSNANTHTHTQRDSPGPVHTPARPAVVGRVILPRPGSVTAAASPSNQNSPEGTAHTSASIMSAVTKNYAGTSPSVGSGVGKGTSSSASTSRPKVNPLLAQADFTQPNHPYREWYKPPDVSAWSTVSGNAGHFGAGRLWPY